MRKLLELDIYEMHIKNELSGFWCKFDARLKSRLLKNG